MLRQWLAPILLLPLVAQAAEIYLCKNYSGGTFWSSAHCGTHNALIERITSVPDTLPFEQQVRIAEQAHAEGKRLAAAPPVMTERRDAQASGAQAECSALDAQVQHLDSLARRPQSGQSQDHIAAQRRRARDRQFQLKCR
jgi:hypothetical protein